MHGPINVKSPNNISEWQMGFNSEFKGLSISFSGMYATRLAHTVILGLTYPIKLYEDFQL